MQSGRRLTTFQVACTYIGTVVGAGFASGQEIYQFFGRFGAFGFVTVAVSVCLFAWLGYLIMRMGQRMQMKSYQELTNHLFGPSVAYVVNWVIWLMMFGMTVAMLAGAGQLFHEHLSIPFQVGGAVTVLVTFFTVTKGIRGILRINTVIVPFMVSFVFLASQSSLLHVHQVLQTLWQSPLSIRSSSAALVSALVYCALNVGLSIGVLVPVGAAATNEVTLRRGAMLGAAGLGAMMLAILVTLLRHPEALSYEVPMAHVAAQFGLLLQWAFVFVLWGEIFSTLVGNVYAVVAQVPRWAWLSRGRFAAIILLAAFLCSHVGFANFVAYGYTLFGWASLCLLIALIAKSQRE